MIASPCINLCQMDAVSGLCLGCCRNLDEIAAWSRADDARRASILASVAERRQQLALRAEKSSDGGIRHG